MQTSLRGVQQLLASRAIRCARVEPYSDGRCRIAVWPTGQRYLAKHTDDADMAYITGLRMAAARDAELARGNNARRA